MRPSPVDLFGEVPVTQQEVRAWLLAVPRIDPDSPRAAAYVRGYGVVSKIQAHKLAGTLEATLAPPGIPSGHWWRRFRWG